MQKLILIDLDGTLTPESTWLALNLKLGITLEKDKVLFERYLQNDLLYKDWITELIRLYKEHEPVSREAIVSLAETIELREDALATVRAIKEKGYHTVLISGSVDVIVETIAKKLGFDEWFACSKLVFDENDTLIDIVSNGDEGLAKAALAKKYCNEHEFILENAFVVEDGGNGKWLFEIAKGILLGSNEKLKPLAWKVVNNLSEIPELI